MEKVKETLQTGKGIPKEWNISNILPIHNKGLKCDSKNF